MRKSFPEFAGSEGRRVSGGGKSASSHEDSNQGRGHVDVSAIVESVLESSKVVSAATESSKVFVTTLSLLGGRKLWSKASRDSSEVHDAIVAGVPVRSMTHLVSEIKSVDEEDVAKVLGLSTRTLRRQAEKPEQLMAEDLASKTWMLAETLATAIEVFGSQEEAERWLSSPVVALNGRRPIDLLRTLQGASIVTDYLGRLEHGVYS